jgi:hypothetical protein
MSPWVSTLLFLGLAVFLFGGNIHLFRRMRQRRREAWSTFAERHAWRFTEVRNPLPLLPSRLEIEGHVEGHRITLCTEVRGHGKGRHEATVARLELGDSAPGSLVPASEGLGPSIRKLFRLKAKKDLSDAELDAVFDPERTSPEGRALLRDSRMRQRLRTLHDITSRFFLADGVLQAERRDVPEDAAVLEAFITPVLELGAAPDARRA